MALSHNFWTRYFRSEFIPHLRALVEALEKRMLPAFSDIEVEAQAVTDEAWNAFMSAPGTGDEDHAYFAEAAEQAGVSHYMLLRGIRQGTINLFAAALFHAFEQQIILFLRRQVLDLRDENDPKLFKINELRTRLSTLGIDITMFPSWATIDELRYVANTVKHAEGSSARKLHSLRPALFENPDVVDFGIRFGRGSPSVFLPLLGEDLYVSLADIQQYRDSLIRFWEELGEAMGQT